MSRFWPHPPHAEDQPFPHAILTTHVLTRGAQAGSLIGTGVGASIFLLRRFNVLKPSPATFITTLLRSTGSGTLIGLGLLSVGLPLQMRGKEPIEWEDRSWRLLENQGQVECDDWMYTGSLAGAAYAVLGGGIGRNAGWRGMIKGVGSVGIGGTVGMLGYMTWRYGVNGGKRKEHEVSVL